MTDSEEGFMVSSDIFDARFSNQLNWSDFAILYRTNAQSRIFEETLRRKNVPYKIYGGLSFYDRKEIKDILAYFRIVINHEDEEALKRTINYPKRGIGDTTIGKIFELATEQKKSPWEIVTGISGFGSHFNAGTQKKISSYCVLIGNFALKVADSDAYNIAREIALGTGIMRELREGKSPEEVSRLENFEELMNALKEFTEAAETNGEPAVLEAYLANVALLTDQDTDDENDRDKVVLMTMHSSKGLEFKHLYITGMEDTLFPSPMSSGNPRELEEERRLFYVALTRAEKQATLTYALNRYKWGNLERSKPSRFLKEIDQSFLDYPQTGGKSFRGSDQNKFGAHSFREEPEKYTQETPSPKMKRIIHSENKSSFSSVVNDPSEYSEGDKVEHERFGEGIIITIEGQPPNTTALVDFKKDGRKKLLLRFAKLKRL
jgi:DNA helicase-2/ATP-dependent DNA helicase PcrA